VCVCVFCVCSLICPACEAHVPNYIAISGMSGSTLFFSILSHKLLNCGAGEGWRRSVGPIT